eukprot:jgi/Ulvmu1/3561/UM166_0015.1
MHDGYSCLSHVAYRVWCLRLAAAQDVSACMHGARPSSCVTCMDISAYAALGAQAHSMFSGHAYWLSVSLSRTEDRFVVLLSLCQRRMAAQTLAGLPCTHFTFHICQTIDARLRVTGTGFQS